MTQRDVGVFPNIPNDVYHSGPGVSKSGLDLLARSPLHFKFATDARNDNEEREETRWQRIGSLVHKLVLEPASIWDEYAEPFVPSDGALATSDQIKDALRALGGKISGTKSELIDRLRDLDPGAVFVDDERAAWEAQLGRRRVINSSELELAEGMAAAIEAHPIGGALFLSSPGEAELSAYWVDPETDLHLRCRPDWWRADGIVVDLKTTEDASREAFERSVLNYRYHVQAAFYLDGLAHAIDQSPDPLPVPTPREFVFLCVEKKPPHAVAVYRLDSETLELGRREYRRDLATLAQCIQADRWPGYGDAVQILGLPDWYVRRELGGAA